MTNGATKKTKFELFVALVHAVAWPVLIAILVIAFWRPLRDSADEFPKMLRNAESLTIGEFSLKLPVYLRHQATPAVRTALAALPPAAVGQLLRLKDTLFFTKDEEATGRAEMGELIARGLVTELPAKDLAEFSSEHHENYSYGIHITELGKNSRDLLRAVTVEFIEDLPGGSVEPAGKHPAE